MGKTTELRKALKRVFFPFAESRGFAIDQRDAPTFTTFRRTAGNVLQIFDVQWEKYGRPRFVINFGTCPASGLVLPDQTIPPGQVLAAWTPQGGRLQPRPGATTGSWFRQDRPFLMRLFGATILRPAPEVVTHLMQLFPEVEAYWSAGIIGRHLRITRRAA
jgi:hypothetical protein